MREASIKPDVTYGILLNGLYKSGNVGDTLKVLDRMSSPGSDVCLDIAILNTIVDGLRKIERLQEAIVFVDERMSQVHGCAPNAVTYYRLPDASVTQRMHQRFRGS
jgi:pentatricopeptide repeat protein